VKLTTFAAALALATLPTLTFAAGCGYGKQKQAMSCAAGTVYDSDTHTCVPVST
jgi:hypothetical protein